jgi:hypothetical protein
MRRDIRVARRAIAVGHRRQPYAPAMLDVALGAAGSCGRVNRSVDDFRGMGRTIVTLYASLVGHLGEIVPAAEPHDLFAIVNQQLTAFRSADFPSAYRQAATGVQQKFTVAQFEKMVRQHYPEMTRACRVEFGLVRQRGETALVQVFFFADDGSTRAFVFSLINEQDAWKIDGVEETGTYRLRDPLAGTHA